MKNKIIIIVLMVLSLFKNNLQGQACPPGCITTSTINISTGVSNNGTVLPTGSFEPHWILTGAPSNSPVTVPAVPLVIPQLNNGSNPSWGECHSSSATLEANAWWISPLPVPSFNTNNPGPTFTPYSFTFRFCVCQAGTFNFNGLLNADDWGRIDVDGTVLATTVSWCQIYPYNLDIPLAVGIHTLTLQLRNTGGVAMGISNMGTITALGSGVLASPTCCPQAVGQLNGRKFSDVNNNGQIDGSDTTLANWQFTLTGPGGTFNSTTNSFGVFNFTNIPVGTYTLSEIIQPGWTAVLPTGGTTTVTITQGTVQTINFLNRYNPIPACACGSWTTTVLTGINGTSLSPGFYPCGTTITNRTISKGQSYRLRFRYNCVGSCNATYNFIENINGTVVSSPAIGGGINIDFTPNESDCGLRSITVTPTCGGMICPPCTICFNVVGCDTCVDPVNDTIYCAPTYGKPIISFCLKNLKPTPIQFYGVTFPAGLQLTTFTLPGDPVPIDTMLDGTIVYQTASPIAPGSNACSFRYRIDGGVYKGQQFCVMVKSFSVYNPANGNFLNCCQDTIPLCFTVPDCIDDCADIVNANITCNTSNQRVLSFQIKNNTPNTLGAYEHFRVFALPNDYFSGFFSLAPGATSSVITHIIPNTIPSGSQYCFTENVHWYYSNGHTCDSICYADTVCLTVPYCGIYPGGDTIKSGYGGGGSTIGSGMGKLIDNFLSGSNQESAINLYPNPTDGLLHIESPYSEQGIQTISIKDMSGREVYFRKAENSHRETLNISHIPTGIYIVTMNGTKNFRLIKK